MPMSERVFFLSYGAPVYLFARILRFYSKVDLFGCWKRIKLFAGWYALVVFHHVFPFDTRLSSRCFICCAFSGTHKVDSNTQRDIDPWTVLARSYQTSRYFPLQPGSRIVPGFSQRQGFWCRGWRYTRRYRGNQVLIKRFIQNYCSR